jgi:hypothetical protein
LSLAPIQMPADRRRFVRLQPPPPCVTTVTSCNTRPACPIRPNQVNRISAIASDANLHTSHGPSIRPQRSFVLCLYIYLLHFHFRFDFRFRPAFFSSVSLDRFRITIALQPIVLAGSPAPSSADRRFHCSLVQSFITIFTLDQSSNIIFNILEHCFQLNVSLSDRLQRTQTHLH